MGNARLSVIWASRRIGWFNLGWTLEIYPRLWAYRVPYAGLKKTQEMAEKLIAESSNDIS